ncbi:P27 family phage terminase small subunit [uncultured Clostridium sp.]|jgi:phage terminase small subunit|uniref:helix-turn-helix domain-containing protein n=1 Tax=uncultured Clostridium sp. TaxID=59620 RepID=UPI002606424D|nr:P27 family phage terminase small subunit [uncultured Clostridium sp.]MCI9110897.1 RNA polymerase subunit sigma-70 [Bacilli bacterium]
MSSVKKSKIQLKAEKDYLAGMTYIKLADKYNVSESTIKTWRKKFGWTRQKGEKVLELDIKQGDFRVKNTQKTALKKGQSKRTVKKLKKETLLTYETTTIEQYDAMRDDLLNQLKNNGVNGLFYNDLVDVYMKMYTIKNKLILDIEERGVAVEWSNGKQTSIKRNDSLDGLHKTVAQMLNILTKLGLDIPENKNINPVKIEDDEAL